MSRKGGGCDGEPSGNRTCRWGQWGAIFAQAMAKAEDANGLCVQTVGSELETEALAPARPVSTALIIVDTDQGHWCLSDALADLGRCSITVRHAHDVIARLQDDSLTVGVVLAPAHDPQFRVLEFFAFMRDAFPLVRRIAYAKHPSKSADALVGGGLLDGVLTCPAPRSELAKALQPALDTASRATRPPVPPQGDQRSDQQLFQAWKGSDRRAFEELDRRYRPRIRQLARSTKCGNEDAEEIVQETLLGLFLSRPTLRGDCTPNRFVCGLTATAVLAHERGVRRRTRLLSALTDAAVTNRAERQWSGQPDEGLRTAELAAHADAAVRSLRAWCRSVFWLCAVQGQNAEQAGATRYMPPAMVDMWLLHARGLVANHLGPDVA